MTKNSKKILPIAILALLGLQACLFDKGEVPEPDPDPSFCDSLGVSYANDIVPIVTNHCAISGCHDNTAAVTTGNFTNYAEIAERANNGKITTQVFDLGAMPQAPGEPLTDGQKDTLRCWIEDGAPDN